MMSLADLADTGAIKVLRDAQRIISQRGWTQEVTRDLTTGEVDLLGAIALAAGAPVGAVDDRPDLLATSVPEARRPAAYVAWEALEYVVGGDPLEWQDAQGKSFQDAFRMLGKAAEHLAVAAR